MAYSKLQYTLLGRWGKLWSLYGNEVQKISAKYTKQRWQHTVHKHVNAEETAINGKGGRQLEGI